MDTNQGYPDGYAVTVSWIDGAWNVAKFRDDFTHFSTAVDAVRNLRSEGAAFALLCVEDEYLVIVRPGPNRVHALISDATMAVDDDYAAEVLDELGIEIPDLDPDELDEIDGWADGDFGILDNVGLSEELLSVLVDDQDAYPSDIIQRIADELDFSDELERVLR
ncbi:tRNA adenosine deaminase-associated protein [Corynebacterium breve]|uniref:tRNA adenosine deaminase-associated protein n=1 Tax=Corynebacterium breve TaxID=3049799 RepID=A0ABY8VE09_9CORY|nr:tRNA adenosine deaminase-associated protein [Corynebacterium breve]WIM67891.1 tRNA adenosine deaminase-associated protein [Corynebacterium breve]